MRKIFAAAHKAEIIARAYGKGRIYGEVAEHLLDPARPNQCDVDPDETASDLARRLSNGSQLRLSYMYMAMAVDQCLSVEGRVETLLKLLELGPTYSSIKPQRNDWHLN